MVQVCQKTLFCYCHVGGELIINADKSVSCKGGMVDGVVINQDTTFDAFLIAVCERLNITQPGRTFQYSLKFDKSCLLPLKDQTALDNLLNFNDDVGHVYISEDRSTAQVVVGSVRCSISENESAADRCLALEAEHINAIQCCECEHVNATPCLEPEHVNETQCLEAEHADETPTLTDENRPGKRPALSSNEWEEEIIGVGGRPLELGSGAPAAAAAPSPGKYVPKFLRERNEHTGQTPPVEPDRWGGGRQDDRMPPPSDRWRSDDRRSSVGGPRTSTWSSSRNPRGGFER
ncbi:hypothetical protein RJ641_028307 [Dillenia turbinata]|uniref:PB1 domain-containing protein n=1 Tax=Dillenia turbinata TaxID=194707 RepID=A0AAN8ZRB7_9MAGN